MITKDITINSRKFDGTIKRSWKADLIEQHDSLLVFLGKFNEEIEHSDLGVIRRGTVSYEYYWLDRWYNIFRFHEPDGDLRNFYCNINKPPIFQNNVLDYIDLDVDVLVWQDFSYRILDEDEFSENSKLHNYGQDLLLKVSDTIQDIEALIHSRAFPFSY